MGQELNEPGARVAEGQPQKETGQTGTGQVGLLRSWIRISFSVQRDTALVLIR